MRAGGVAVIDAGTAPDLAGRRIDAAKVIVDALLGTGTTRPVEGRFAEAIERNERRAGAARGRGRAVGARRGSRASLGACVKADHTVTFACAKVGLVTAPGFTWTGTLHVVDIGIPHSLVRERTNRWELLDDDCLDRLPSRSALAHKGTSGHVLVVADRGAIRARRSCRPRRPRARGRAGHAGRAC